jgi:DNA-binding NtrC family response regulator
MQKRILINDDDDRFRRSLATFLDEAGYSVAEAVTGNQALAQVKSSGQQFDLLITDLAMPDMDGQELITELKCTDSSLPVIAMSGSFSGRLLRFATTFGVATIGKPFKRASLLTLVESALSSSHRAQLSSLFTS